MFIYQLVFGDGSVYPYRIVQKIEKLKLKIKNFRNDQIKNENNFKKRLTLLASFCLLIVAPKTTCKSKEGERRSKEKKKKKQLKNYKLQTLQNKAKIKIRTKNNTKYKSINKIF